MSVHLKPFDSCLIPHTDIGLDLRNAPRIEAAVRGGHIPAVSPPMRNYLVTQAGHRRRGGLSYAPFSLHPCEVRSASGVAFQSRYFPCALQESNLNDVIRVLQLKLPLVL